MNTSESIDSNSFSEYQQQLIDWENNLIAREEAIKQSQELLQKEIFEKSKTYTSTIISVGYASLFIIISTLKDKFEISQKDLGFIAFWLIISISLFIFWEVADMIHRAWINGTIATATKNKGLKFSIFMWILVLAGTIFPAILVIIKLLNLLHGYILS